MGLSTFGHLSATGTKYISVNEPLYSRPIHWITYPGTWVTLPTVSFNSRYSYWDAVFRTSISKRSRKINTCNIIYKPVQNIFSTTSSITTLAIYNWNYATHPLRSYEKFSFTHIVVQHSLLAFPYCLELHTVTVRSLSNYQKKSIPLHYQF